MELENKLKTVQADKEKTVNFINQLDDELKKQLDQLKVLVGKEAMLQELIREQEISEEEPLEAEGGPDVEVEPDIEDVESNRGIAAKRAEVKAKNAAKED